jgi:hypothetical protein
MRKHLIHHTWTKETFEIYRCSRCYAMKVRDWSFGKVVFYDRFGKLHPTTPNCELPNIKLT